MQPLKLMNNVQKARLLHNLLVNEIPGFISYLKELADIVVTDSDRVKAEWENGLFPAEFWIEQAGEVSRKAAKYSKDLPKSSAVFADQLFDGFLAMFTVHALVQYVANGRHQEAKFKPAVELLFN